MVGKQELALCFRVGRPKNCTQISKFNLKIKDHKSTLSIKTAFELSEQWSPIWWGNLTFNVDLSSKTISNSI